ncbi:YceI family protein [Thermobifida cellulosilytica]|jgi:polyisoprenoid-binding protein YceI|uniref:Lipid/polyisoprenoid-binding YceI-like domain-containing protein n=1 Tax=Thermobifida cellulosilytica TB100 TaxID=665004 RepID=A0A147KLV9_THECS|nr:YceI family protein [Thermobifida cellulosilytica]KUP98243.1 hypothetical protein AC529_02020 [Thermobifida cellulosilytica TB100]
MTVQAENTQQVGPQPGTWYLDPLHSNLIFVAHYLRFGRVQGTLNRARGTVLVAENPLDSKVEVTVETGSLNTGVRARDAHLCSPEFLDAERYPETRFVSTELEEHHDRRAHAFIMRGDLTLHGVTRQISLDCQWVGEAPHYLGVEHGHGHFFTGSGVVRLSDFGISDGGELPWGGRLIGDEVDIVLELRLQDREPEELA